MSINPQLLVADTANNASESDAADEQELGEREFFVERLRDVAVQDLIKLGTPLEEWGPEGDRFEVRFLVRWLGFDDPEEDTWEPKRNLAGWQPSYDEDLAKIAADKPPGFSLAGLHAEAKRLNEQWRKAKKKSAAVPAKKSTKQAGASTSTKASAKDDKGKKAKGEKKEKKKKPRTSKDGAKPDSSTKPRSGRGSTANASPAPSNSSRVARSLRRSALGESLDQAALNEFIETNAPSSVRSLRFSPPPKHDQHGHLITPSSDTEDSPTPEPTQQDGTAGATAQEKSYGFARGDDDLEEDGLEVEHASATHSSDIKPSIPSTLASGSRVAHGFAAGDSDEDEDENEPGQEQPAAAVPAPAGETAYGFAGSSDDDDGDDHDEAMQCVEPEPLPAGSAVNANAPIIPTAETASTSFGFAGDDDDDDDDMYFPDPTPFEQARAAAAVAQPAGQAMLERVKMEDTQQGFAGSSDDEDDDIGNLAVENTASGVTTTSQGDVTMAEGTAQVEVSTNNQRVSKARAEEDRRQIPEATPSAAAARAEPIDGETTQLAGRTQDVGDEQRELAESPAGEAATSGPSLTTRHEADGTTSAAAQSAPAAAADQASALSTAMSPPPATGSRTAPARPAPEKDIRTSRQPAKLTTAANDEQDVAVAGSVAQPRVSSSPVSSRKSALPHPGRQGSQDQNEDADAASERARLPIKRKRTADTAGDAAGAGDEAASNALARVKIRRKGEPRAGEVSPVEGRPSPGPSGGSDSRGSGSAIKAADPFNHGRIRSNVSNGYIRWNAAALRSKNLPQLLTANEKVSWPDDGPYSVFDGSGDVESEKIKFLWSMGRYGDPINGTDNIDELFKPPPLSRDLDVWIAPPPDENKAGLSKSARAHLNEYQALQLVLSSYEGLRQADSPRNSVKLVFVHVSKLGELGSTTGAFAQLEHLRSQPGTRFFVYGRGENSKRAVFQFWRSAVAITFSPAALLRQARRLEALLPSLAACVDEDTRTHNLFPWIPLQYLLPGGPLGRPALEDGTTPTSPLERDDANRAAVFQILPLLAHKRLILADLAPPKKQGPLLRSVFPAEMDRVPYAGPQRAFFDILSELGPKMDLARLQSLICAWRSRYPLIRNWQIICTQQEVAAASKSVLPGIELCSIIDVEKRFLSR